jgi:ligand-binding SRPBCC domain-containing protein
MSHILHREQWVPRPLDEVFAFFSDAGNLEQITPAWLNFRIQNSFSGAITAGTRIEYRLAWHGIPLRWTTRIVRWEPPHSFEDRQISGPFRLWRHTHRFEAELGGTRLIDDVRYALPLGLLGRAVHVLAVRRDLERIFDFREQRIRALFGGEERAA